MAFTLPDLPYAYDALEPHIDARTMEIHHGKHHAGYTSKLNDAIAGTDLEGKSIEDILNHCANISGGIRNNAGGFWNHSLFWNIMGPDAGGEPTGDLAAQIDKDFGSFDGFKDHFAKAAATRFGSGWAWLVKHDDGHLTVSSSPNQDNPLMYPGTGTPIMGLDVWEHAYYLNYQNRRPDYIGAFWNVVDWNKVAANFAG